MMKYNYFYIGYIGILVYWYIGILVYYIYKLLLIKNITITISKIIL